MKITKVTKAKILEEKSICTICNQNFKKNEDISILKCGHKYHSICFKNSNSCNECININSFNNKYKFKDISKKNINDNSLKIFITTDFYLNNNDYIQICGFDNNNRIIFRTTNMYFKYITDNYVNIPNIDFLHHLIVYTYLDDYTYRYHIPLEIDYNIKENNTKIYIKLSMQPLIMIEYICYGAYSQELEDETIINKKFTQLNYNRSQRYIYGKKVKWVEYQNGYFETIPNLDYYYDKLGCCNII
jgi:hypothetical protein